MPQRSCAAMFRAEREHLNAPRWRGNWGIPRDKDREIWVRVNPKFRPGQELRNRLERLPAAPSEARICHIRHGCQYFPAAVAIGA
jgi:hypothetical protein